MTELIVVRHGETDWNRQHRFQGQIDVPLNDVGRAQAERLAQRLIDERFDVVVASDLQRARTTAELAAAGHAIVSEPLWREQSFGVLEGLDAPTIIERHPQLWAHWLRHDADYALPGGESVRMFHQRVQQALQRLLLRYEGARIAVFTHGGVLDMLYRHVTGLGIRAPRDFGIPNAGLNRLELRAEGWVIRAWADIAHLAGALDDF
jgi:probable phosphoglycerate mutase